MSTKVETVESPMQAIQRLSDTVKAQGVTIAGMQQELLYLQAFSEAAMLALNRLVIASSHDSANERYEAGNKACTIFHTYLPPRYA